MKAVSGVINWIEKTVKPWILKVKEELGGQNTRSRVSSSLSLSKKAHHLKLMSNHKSDIIKKMVEMIFKEGIEDPFKSTFEELGFENRDIKWKEKYNLLVKNITEKEAQFIRLQTLIKEEKEKASHTAKLSVEPGVAVYRKMMSLDIDRDLDVVEEFKLKEPTPQSSSNRLEKVEDKYSDSSDQPFVKSPTRNKNIKEGLKTKPSLLSSNHHKSPGDSKKKAQTKSHIFGKKRKSHPQPDGSHSRSGNKTSANELVQERVVMTNSPRKVQKKREKRNSQTKMVSQDEAYQKSSDRLLKAPNRGSRRISHNPTTSEVVESSGISSDSDNKSVFQDESQHEDQKVKKETPKSKTSKQELRLPDSYEYDSLRKKDTLKLSLHKCDSLSHSPKHSSKDPEANKVKIGHRKGPKPGSRPPKTHRKTNSKEKAALQSQIDQGPEGAPTTEAKGRGSSFDLNNFKEDLLNMSIEKRKARQRLIHQGTLNLEVEGLGGAAKEEPVKLFGFQ